MLWIDHVGDRRC